MSPRGLLGVPYLARNASTVAEPAGSSAASRAMQRFLIILGAVSLAAGLLWPWLSRLPFGRLPGDITLGRENFSVHVPLTTSVLLSLVLTLILRSWRK